MALYLGIVPSSSIEAANAKVRNQRRRRPIPKIVCMVVLPLQWVLVDMPTSHRHRLKAILAAVLLVGVVQLGLNLEIYSTKKLDSGNLGYTVLPISKCRFNKVMPQSNAPSVYYSSLLFQFIALLLQCREGCWVALIHGMHGHYN